MVRETAAVQGRRSGRLQDRAGAQDRPRRRRLMITVLTWLWHQQRGPSYSAAHVNIWADMVRRNLSMPHRIACVTDHPEGIDPSVEIIAPPRDFEDVRIP